ncbi:MAG: metal-dependent transcriptional regulator [Clostridia bacterium]|nr:metal-dependent transcriptional regulator [Clostridiales bacterium]MDU2293185.1 metal-dependent transcriptional regulator [Peptococcus niger]MDU7245209.1 metal-dependent transcriptional regulator [Clostridiales bacterium]MDU7505075.1 metal-dependent transcriptional regulator [Clostridia bacterium]
MSTNDEIYESGEDYLECILRLQNRQGDVKSIDVANAMNYSKPSISRAMKILAEKGFIQMDKKKYIHLTEEGLKKAEAVYKRHLLIKEALITLLDVSPETAEQDACRIEHIVSQETVDKLSGKLEAHLLEE